MKFKKWFFFVSVITVLLLVSLGSLVYFSTTHNILYQQGQERLEDIVRNPDAEVIFLGDSSLANGVNNELFAKLSKKEVLNLWTTGGGHNLAATYNLLRHVLNDLHHVQTIIIMHTPSVYGYNFLLGGYFSTLGDLDSKVPFQQHLLTYKDFIVFYFLNLNSIGEYLKMQKIQKMTANTTPWTFKNGKITRPLNKLQTEYLKIGETKAVELKMIDDLIAERNITTVYIQGPLHHDVYNRYHEIIHRQQTLIKKTFKHIIFIESYLYPQNENMGNTIDHVDKSYKDTATKFYYEHLKKYIRP